MLIIPTKNYTRVMRASQGVFWYGMRDSVSALCSQPADRADAATLTRRPMWNTTLPVPHNVPARARRQRPESAGLAAATMARQISAASWLSTMYGGIV